ncbi:MAG: tripartite tricarboxylate transporter substrate binding protein [Hyphomicrobiales bacterium]|nr:tripartite tricarboxylate transporter substrate binding protein [Hyphomicrobiales bacterium]
MKRRHLLAAGLATLSLLSLVPALAQSRYPERPIRLVIPYPPGGVYDSTGRPWADKVKPHLGTVVIENIGGGGSSLGTAAVARAQPDGYSILLAGTSGLVINPIAASHSPYDPIKDFEPIAILGLNPTAIDVHPAQPIHTLRELIDFAKANPGKLSYGSSGVGTINHLIGELLKSHTGIDIAHVPYRGAGPAMSDLVSGHIPMLLQSVTGQAIDLHRTGKLRMLAVASAARTAAAPDVPTVVEAGMPDLVAAQFIGLFAPRGTPKAIVEQIADATRKAMADPGLQRMFASSGFEPDPGSSPEKARLLVDQEIAKWRPVIKSIGLKLD